MTYAGNCRGVGLGYTPRVRGSLTHLVALAGFLLVSAMLLWWAWLPPRLRRGLALAASGAGLLFLVLALNTAGHREAETTGSFVLGSAYVSGQASASASLPYYVITAVCLLMGTAALALPDAAARGLARHPVASAVAVSVLATLVRFALEKAAAPKDWTWAVGVTWLAPLVGAFLAIRLREQGHGLRTLAAALLVYGLASRAWVALTYLAATGWRLGSHYDLSSAWVQLQDPVTGMARSFSPGSVSQLLYVVALPQLMVWPLYTVAVGLLGAAAVYLLVGAWRPSRRVALPVDMAPASQDR
jgi:hypothetical protein